MGDNYELENKVLCKAIQEVVRQAREFTQLTGDQIQNNFEEAIKVSTIHSILQLKDFIGGFQETVHIAEAGILEAIAVDEHNSKLDERLNIHSNLVNINNTIGEMLGDLVVNVLGEDKMQELVLQAQLEDII